MVRSKKASTPGLLTKMNMRTILRSKLQFLAVILITALAMTLFVGLTSNAKSINDRVNELYESSNMADIWTTTKEYDSNDLKSIEEIVGDRGETEERFMMPAKLQTYEATALMSKNLPTINKAANTDSTDNDSFFIIDRRLLESEAQGTDIKWRDDDGYLTIPVKFSISSLLQVLNATTLNDIANMDNPILDISILDALNMCLIDGKENILDEPYLTLNLKVTGVMDFAENVQNSQMNNTSFLLSIDYFKNEAIKALNSSFETPSIISPTDPNFLVKSMLKAIDFMSYAPEVIIDGMTKSNQYVTKVFNEDDIKAVRGDIQEYFNNKATAKGSNLLMCIDKDALSSNVTIQNDITQAGQLAYIFPTIFFLVAILVVLTTISQIIIKERIQIGTMKALGISTTRVISHYMMLSVDIVLIGIVVGIIAGPFIIPMIMNQKYDILYSLPKISYTIAVPEMLISTLLVLLVTALVTFLVVKNSAKLKPAESMRPKEVKVSKASNNDFKITKGSIPIRMAIRNIKLNLAKSLMVIIGVCGCTALLVCGFGIDDTLNHGVESDINNFYSSDIYTSYTSNTSKLDKIKAIEGVKEVEEYTALPTTVNNTDSSYQTLVYVINDDSSFFNIDGYELKDKIIMSNKISKQLGVKVGDVVEFQSLGMSFKAEVGLILDVFYQHGIYVNASYNDCSKLSGIKTNAWVDIEDGYTNTDIISKINEIEGIANSKTYQENVDLINSYMSSISLMTLAVKVFAILLAIVVLYNLSLLNFKERARDIATLKVLGFSKLEIAASLFYESLILTIIGVAFGMCLGLPMEILVLVVNQTPLVEFLYTVFPISYLISFAITIGTNVFVNWILTFKIKGVAMVESLKSVE